MVFEVNLRKYFTPRAIAQTLEKLPPLQTPVLDRIYPESVRKQHQLPVLGINEIKRTVKNVPVVRRGTAAVPLQDGQGGISYIEPQPIEVSSFISAKELNDMKLLSEKGIQEYIAGVIDYQRQVIRKTTEALAAQSLKGEISYPMKTNAGYDLYVVSFGSTNSYTVSTPWNAENKKFADVLLDLIRISELLNKKGYSNVAFLAGSRAFITLAQLVLNLQGDTIKAQVTEKAITLAGFTVELFNGVYEDPRDGSTRYVVEPNYICAVALDAPFTLYYCAIDDIEAGLVAMPYYATPDMKKNPSGVEIVGKSKPLPVPVVDAICWAEVISS